MTADEQTRRHVGKGASRPLLRGILFGAVLTVALQVGINETPIADWIISPLLLSDTSGPAGAIVVLGAGVTDNCVPNLNALRRVMLGVRLWRQKRAPIVMFTGGTGDTSCPVARAMADLAREIGLPASSVRTETSSRNTHENARRSAPLLRALGFKQVLLVTDRLHMRRAEAVFLNEGFQVGRASVPIYEGHVDNLSMLRAGLREFVALAYYRLRGWTGKSTPEMQIREPFEHSPELRRRDVEGNSSPSYVKNPQGPVVVLGASYAGGWPLTEVGAISVVNRGVAGQQSFELLGRLDRDVAASSPRAVIVWGFINDIFRAPAGLTEQAAERVRNSYAEIVRRARDHGIEPILATEVTVRPPAGWSETVMHWLGRLLGKSSYQERINREVIGLNAWLVELARREHLLLLDYERVLAGPRGYRVREFTREDGSHISAAGYVAISEFTVPILEQHFAVRQ